MKIGDSSSHGQIPQQIPLFSDHENPGTCNASVLQPMQMGCFACYFGVQSKKWHVQAATQKSLEKFEGGDTLWHASFLPHTGQLSLCTLVLYLNSTISTAEVLHQLECRSGASSFKVVRPKPHPPNHTHPFCVKDDPKNAHLC